MGIMITTPEGIEAFRLLSIKGRLSLELKGMTSSNRRSTFAHVKQEFGFQGNRQSVYDQYIAMLKEKGILADGTDTDTAG